MKKTESHLHGVVPRKRLSHSKRGSHLIPEETLHAALPQLCLTLCDPLDWSPAGSSVHGILQARILEWVVMPSFRGSSWPRDQTHVSYISCLAGRFFTTGTNWEAPVLVDVEICVGGIQWRDTVGEMKAGKWKGLNYFIITYGQMSTTFINICKTRLHLLTWDSKGNI